MILKEYFQRKKIEPTVSLDNEGVGLVDVGDMILEELFELSGDDPELMEAIEQFMKKKKEREDTIKNLEEKSTLPGVKGLTAKNELIQIQGQDLTEMNR